MAAAIDLRKDLPKVRAQFAKVCKAQKRGACDYTAPCVIGAMVDPHKRRFLEDAELRGDTPDSEVGTLIDEGLLQAPKEQRRDLVDLQRAFDSGDADFFRETLIRMERKYLDQQVSA